MAFPLHELRRDTLLKDLQAEVQRNPALLMDVLPVLADATQGFVAQTQRNTDAKMSFALLTTISLMRKLNPQSKADRVAARLTLVYGKVPKEGASEVEKKLHAFVEAADAAFPAEAADHYRTLRT